jgi:hypothetical protein
MALEMEIQNQEMIVRANCRDSNTNQQLAVEVRAAAEISATQITTRSSATNSKTFSNGLKCTVNITPNSANYSINGNRLELRNANSSSDPAVIFERI